MTDHPGWAKGRKKEKGRTESRLLHEASSLVTKRQDISPSVCWKVSGMEKLKPRGVGLRMLPKHGLFDGHKAELQTQFVGYLSVLSCHVDYLFFGCYS